MTDAPDGALFFTIENTREYTTNVRLAVIVRDTTFEATVWSAAAGFRS